MNLLKGNVIRINKLDWSHCPQEEGFGGQLKTDLPHLWKGQLIPVLSRWDLSHAAKKTISLWHMSEAAGKINAASLLWPHCSFTHRDLLAGFSVCQHLLTTPEQGHRMADAPQRRRHLVMQQQICSSSWAAQGCSIPLLRDITWCIAWFPVSVENLKPLETSCTPYLSCTPQTAPLVQDTKME